MGILKPALIIGSVAAVYALAILALIWARVSVIVVALVTVPVGIGGLVTLSVWRLGTWREGTQRRAVLILQAAATQLIARSMTGAGIGALQASGSLTASETPSSLNLFVEYVLGSRGGVAWDLLSAVLGLAFVMASVRVAQSSIPVTPRNIPGPLSMPVLDPTPLTQSQVSRARKYRTYDSDLPPRTEFWVGREEETRLARELQRGILTITGIGGQGKSYLAAKLLEEWRSTHPQGFWDWRDCREEGDRLEIQLVSVIERVSAGEIDPRSLDGASPERLARVLFKITRSTSGFLVLDNVDHYTNADQGTFIEGVDALVREALRSKTDFLMVVTCRPRISYPDINFREIPLRGLSLDETKALFMAKGADLSHLPNPEDALRRIHEHTRGHPFWLNVVSTQVQRAPQRAIHIVQEIVRDTGDDRIVAMLRPVWRGLNENQKLILHIMSESPKAEERGRLERYALAEIPSPNQFSRAFRTLESLGLVVSKEEPEVETRYEIHPVVRQFINQEFPSPRERAPYMQAISSNCGHYILRLQEGAGKGAIITIETFEYAAIGTEMQLRSGDTIAGMKSISQIHDEFIARGLGREIVRLADRVIEDLDWGDGSLGRIPEFHSFVASVVVTLAENHREASATQLVERYSPFAVAGTAQYVAWCATRSGLAWTLGRFEEAIRWGREGQSIKKESDMDTRKDTAHYLNLALRDSGQVDDALAYFLRGRTLEEVVQLNHHEANLDASFFGNIGRCLYLLGRFRQARVCCARSADLLYGETHMRSIINQGWAGLWIGDVCAKEGDIDTAVLFYRDCKNVWSVRAPLLLQRIEEAMAKIPPGGQMKVVNSEGSVRLQCHALVRTWLEGA